MFYKNTWLQINQKIPTESLTYCKELCIQFCRNECIILKKKLFKNNLDTVLDDTRLLNETLQNWCILAEKLK